MATPVSVLPGLIRTEALKLGTTRFPVLLGGGVCAVTLVLALQPVLRAGRDGTPSLGTVGATLGVVDAMSRGALGVLLLGVVVVTTEFRHQTVTAALLSSPSRTAFLTAKAVAVIAAGLALGLLALVIVTVVGAVPGAIRWDLLNGDIALHIVGLVLTYPLYGLLGVAAGALLHRNQPLAVILPAVWVLGLEGLAVAAGPAAVAAWSIGGTTAALQNAATMPGVLSVWLGGAALASYGLVLLLAGLLWLNRADLT
jgi:ABC-2 type transport system permease protein